MIRMRKTGWTGARAWIRAARQSLEAAADAMLTELTEHTALQLRTDIETQARPWAPLAGWYLALKVMKGLDPRIFVATGWYLTHIWAHRLGRYEWLAGWVETTHPPSGLSVTKLWELLEFGTHVIPARPHVRPVADQAQRDIPAFIKGYGFKYLGKVP